MNTQRLRLLTLGICLAFPSCGGATNSSSQATPAAPLFPGATKMAGVPTHITYCHHDISSTSYQVQGDEKTVADWYAARMSDAVRVDKVAGSQTSMSVTAFSEPDGIHAVSIAQATVPGDAKKQRVFISLDTYSPALSKTQLQTMQAAAKAADPVTRAAAKAALTTLCAATGGKTTSAP